MNKKAFSTIELLVAITLIVIIVAFLTPSLKTMLPNQDKEKAKFAYNQITTIISRIIDSPEFTINPEEIRNFDGSFNSKLFFKPFKNYTNVIEEKVGGVNECFMTDNQITYCFDTIHRFENEQIIKYYTSSNPDVDNIETSYYVSVGIDENEDCDDHCLGKVSVVDPGDPERLDVDCADAENYKKYNQCKLEDYLLNIKNQVY